MPDISEMPTLVGETSLMDQPVEQKQPRYRGTKEVDLREAVEAWGRARWPEARVCHELVMNRGTSRLDLAFVSPNHLVSIELKSGYDRMERAIHQVAMARLTSHEAWLICDAQHSSDMKLVQYLLPTIGIAEAANMCGVTSIRVISESVLADPHPQAAAALLWVPELAAALGLGGSRPGSHAQLALRLAALPAERRTTLICQELRARNALWRADPPIPRVTAHA